jgi:hypothetical protein
VSPARRTASGEMQLPADPKSNNAFIFASPILIGSLLSVAKLMSLQS